MNFGLLPERGTEAFSRFDTCRQVLRGAKVQPAWRDLKDHRTLMSSVKTVNSRLDPSCTATNKGAPMDKLSEFQSTRP